MGIARASESTPWEKHLFQSDYGHFIGGQWVSGRRGEKIPVSNPATGEVLSYIQSGDAADVERAVDAAYQAFATWSRSKPEERQQLLLELARRLENRLADYAMMETLNNGKPISESLSFDLPTAIGSFNYFAGGAFALNGQTIEYPGSTTLIYREPIGVCAQIIPWNVPLIMMAAKIAPAIAAGNTVVLKPSEICCLSVLEFFRDVQDVLPPGVVNVVTGYGPQVGEPLVTNPKVRKVALTGSKTTARRIMDYASVNIIPQTLELGGKSANIICEDADLDAAAEAAALSTIFNKGEVCLAGSRTLVHEKVHDDFLERFTRILKGIRVGDPTDPATQLGALASRAQFVKVSSYLELGRSEGATPCVGGGPARVSGFEDGLFIQPTIFADVNNSMRIAREEIFGPVTCVIPWKDEDEVVRIANDSDYGLGGGLWTRNLARGLRMSRAIETGTVWVNCYLTPVPGIPVGGYKESGFGREGWLGTLDHYTQVKSVVMGLEEGPKGFFDRPV